MIPLPPRYTFSGKDFNGGGMSSAYLCNDTHLDRPVLIKTLQQGVDQSRLRDEVAALTSIRSKHVVQIYDVIKDNQENIIGMVEEFLPGDELGVLAPITDLTLFVETIYAIASGIADIHLHGKVHRDIKPNNMKFDAEGTLKIFDFGLSRPDDVNAKTIGAVGTLGYIAPEQCVGDDETAIFSQPVDVYAFGATALKMLRTSLPSELRQLPPKLPCAKADFAAQKISMPLPIAQVLNMCLSENASDRPKMETVLQIFYAQLTSGRHRATIVHENTKHFLSSASPIVNINGGSLGSFQLKYDGLQFLVLALSGDVYINAKPAAINDALPGACVITLGAPHLGMHRKYITVDLSHPEVTI